MRDTLWRQVTYKTAYLVLLALATVPVSAKCRPQGPPLTEEMVEAFIAKPTLLLLTSATSRSDADAMAIAVSQYIAANASAMPALVSILPQASIDQRKAIGRGLYRIVNVCSIADQAIVIRTQTVVRTIGDATVVEAYRVAENAATDSAGSARYPAAAEDGADLKGRQSLIGNPVMNDAMSLKLSDPFALPEVR